MEDIFKDLLLILSSSSGTAIILYIIQRHDNKHDLLIGLGHDRIFSLAGEYIKRGYITKDEYDNLNTYIYQPYKKRGGNGTGEKLMKEVERLPLREN
jgi:hypothetical protein